MKKKKRGQASILTSILIILGVIVAIAIVYNVVKPLVSEKAGEIPGNIEKLKLMNALMVNSFNHIGGNLEVSVSRESNSGDINGIRYTINTDEQICYAEQADILQPLETKTFNINTLYYNCSGVVQGVSVEPVFGKIEGGGTEELLENTIYINSCRDLNESGKTYRLTSDITNNNLSGSCINRQTVGNLAKECIRSCINITAENIVLDCQNNKIRSDDAVVGIYSNKQYTTIRNCDVTMKTDWPIAGSHGIELAYAHNSIIENNILNENHHGIFVMGSNNVKIQGNIMNFNHEQDGNGILIVSSSNNLIIDNVLENNGRGIELNNAKNNILKGNKINSSSWDGILLINAGNNTLDNNNVCGNRIDFECYKNVATEAPRGTGNTFTNISSSCGWPVIVRDYQDCRGKIEQCNSCGVFGLFCSRAECESIEEGCYFINGLFINTCGSCSSANSCSNYNEDEQSCNDDVCNLHCAWNGNSCVEFLTGYGLGTYGAGVYEGVELPSISPFTSLWNWLKKYKENFEIPYTFITLIILGIIIIIITKITKSKQSKGNKIHKKYKNHKKKRK